MQEEQHSKSTAAPRAWGCLYAARRLLRFYPLNTPRISILRRLPGVPATCSNFKTKRGDVIAGWYPGTQDIISKSLFWLGDFDPWVPRALKLLCAPGETILDIGANIGVVPLELSEYVGPYGRIICFEPYPHTAEMLRQNIAVNQVQNVEIHESAISSASGHLTLSMPDGQPGHVAAGAMEDPGACSVVARTLDEMVSRLGLTSVAACKIDVEGHELSVFEGATDVLRRGMINAFVFERLLMDGNADPVISLLRQAEYEVYRIYKRPLSFRFCSLTRSTDGIATDDYVALLKSSAAHQRVASLIT